MTRAAEKLTRGAISSSAASAAAAERTKRLN